MAKITTILFNWPLPSDAQPHVSIDAHRRYDAAWEIIASEYPGLRRLRVSLMPPGRSACGEATPEQFKRAWLEPLDRFTTLKLETFEIFAPKTFYFYLKDVPSDKPYRVIETAHLDFPVGVL